MDLVQINLHHSITATARLVDLINRSSIVAALIQEPWVDDNGTVCGLNVPGFKLCCRSKDVKTRSCILIRKDVNFFFLENYSDDDFTAIVLERKRGKPICLCSAYCPYEVLDGFPSANFVRAAKETKWICLIGCDANAHHTQWGCKENNVRGELFFNYLINSSLSLCNRGKEPTFFNKKSKTIVDVSLVSSGYSDIISNWRVSKEASLSDHAWIFLKLNFEFDKEDSFVNPQKANWEKYSTSVSKILSKPPEDIHTFDDLDKTVDSLTKTLVSSFEKSLPKAFLKGKGKKKPPWWNSEISKSMRDARSALNKAKYFNNDTTWDDYKCKKRALKYLIRRHKRASWRSFCESISSNNEASRLRKIMSKRNNAIGSIKLTDDTWAESSKEVLDELMTTHFPGCVDEIVERRQLSHNSTDIVSFESDDVYDRIFSIDKVKWAIDSFLPFKAHGFDGIIPKMLQVANHTLLVWLVKIFKASIRLGYIPKTWRKVKVVFIPKSGKTSHTAAKDYRPISLSSFLLKTMERLVDLEVRTCLPRGLLARSQHAYMKGRSTETALHEVVSFIEKGMNSKDYVLAAFLDIEGAFNNVKSESIRSALRSVKVKDYVINWIMNMLSTRTVSSTVGSSSCIKTVRRGTPQGGVISPLLWLLVVNMILKPLENEGVKVVAYADDLVVMVRGKKMFLNSLSELLSGTLARIHSWASTNGLGVNPLKTELVLFTTEHKLPSFKMPVLAGESLKLSDHARYLGVILDRKMNWSRNVDERIKKANNALYICKKCIGTNWGFTPRICYWIYTAIVRPILTYGCLVWWKATDKRYIKNKLMAVQRLACILISGAMKTTATESLDIILGFTPIDLHIRSLAAKSAIRLQSLGCFKNCAYGHGSILQEMGMDLTNTTTDLIVPTFKFDNPFLTKYPTRQEWDDNEVVGISDIEVFTDGSKMDTGTGSGVFVNSLSVEKFYKLGDENSVFQAEVLAISKAAEILINRDIRNKSITIFVDSQAAIKAIASRQIKSKVVLDCRTLLNRLCDSNITTLSWVPGHSGHEGNEKADELARKGSESISQDAVANVYNPISSLYRTVDRITKAAAVDRWMTSEKCKCTKMFFPSYDAKKTKFLLQESKSSLCKLISIITGHNLLGKHAKRLGLAGNDSCRYCGCLDCSEDTQHILCQCEALARRRMYILGSYVFDIEEDMSSIRLIDLKRFFAAIGCNPKAVSLA